jgi:hypothetical protein
VNGLLLKESLADIKVLELVHIAKTESWQVTNATRYQPAVWTALSFEAEDSQADVIANKLSQALKLRGWYITASTATNDYVLFPCKVFKYRKGDGQQRAEAKRYGRSFGIPESQLDWSE